jgi:hypothetical protein
LAATGHAGFITANQLTVQCLAKKGCCGKIDESSSVTLASRWMALPRYTLRSILVLVTASAVLFLLLGLAFRGQLLAWGAVIAVLSLGVTALVHAACFGVVWCCAKLSPGQREDAP